MHRNKKITKKRHRRKSQTRKRTRHTKPKPRFSGGFRLNIDPASGFIDASQQPIIDNMKHVIDAYIGVEINKGTTGGQQSKEYVDNKELFDDYKTNLSPKKPDVFTKSDCEKLLNILSIIMQNKITFMKLIYSSVELLQKFLASIYLYFANDIPMKDSTDFILRKRITNNTPYIDVVHNRKGYEPVYDINEMFTLFRKELEGKDNYDAKMDENYLKKLNVTTEFKV
jgi:hypothetical protein